MSGRLSKNEARTKRCDAKLSGLLRNIGVSSIEINSNPEGGASGRGNVERMVRMGSFRG